jgi:hypothetical protein
MTNIDVGEQIRRREYMRDTKAAAAQGEETEEYRAKRDRTVEEWAAWFHAEMERCSASDPVEILPHALTLVQERATAAARGAAKAAAQSEVRRMLLALRLSDAQLDGLMRLCQPLAPHCRDALLRILAHELRGRRDVGDGELHRIARTILKDNGLFDPPNLDGAEETPQPRRLARGGNYR